MSDGASPRERYSAQQIARRVAEIATQIRGDAGADAEIHLLGILKGAACFLADLMRAIPGPVRYDFIDVIRDISDTEIAEALEIDFLSHFEMAGKRIYLLKDVVTTGVIENYLLTQIRQKDPADLKLVALLDRPTYRTVEIGVDYRAFQVDEGSFAGYGLEVGGRWANLPYIGVL
ncbi:MAG: phosphoribosyltransferase [Thermoanaerobaculia bacterium]